MQATFKVNIKVYWNKSGDYEVMDATIEENEPEDEVESQKDADENIDEGYNWIIFFCLEIDLIFLSILSFVDMKENEADEPRKKKLKNKSGK